MTTPTIADYLKYANLQMAAEAFLFDEATLHVKVDIPKALKEGNLHASVFTQAQADAFAAQWEVLDQQANTSTGFSGTLFKAIKDNLALGIHKDELVLSFRSTEFVDDAIRDSAATNSLEIKDGGFAWGQLRDMEAWYQELNQKGLLDTPSGDPAKLSVTGYSLGGHLATTFNLLRQQEAQAGQALPGAPSAKHSGGGTAVGGSRRARPSIDALAGSA